MTAPASNSGHWRFSLLAVALVVTAIGVGWGVGRLRNGPEPASPSLTSKRAELIFRTSCAQCHGLAGHGDGVSWADLKPAPRDFAARPWRFEPTKASIRRVILAGIPDTAMPASEGILADADVELLVDYVYELATAPPAVAAESSADQQLVKSAGFIDLLGTAPPPLTVCDATGSATRLADLRGRLVIVHFWGTTCVHCFAEMPPLHQLATKHAPRGLTVLHVCADAVTAKEAQKVLDKHAPDVRALTDETGLGLARFEVQSLPAVWLIAPDGTAIGRAAGAVDWRSPAALRLIDRWLPIAEK